MIKATLIGVALTICSVSTPAQEPTPAPAPVPPSQGVKPAPATPRATRPPRAPRIWSSDDMLDLEGRLDALKDFDLLTPPALPMEPALDMDLDFDLAPHAFELDRLRGAMPDLDFDLEMPEMPDIAPSPMIEPMWVEPMIPAAPMLPMEPIFPSASLVTPMPPDVSWAPLGAGELRARGAADMARIQGLSPFERQFGNFSTQPAQGWSQSDPADSLYRVAREALNRGEYRRAAQLFADITQKFPNSVYSGDARYWRAFALYRIGGASDLREALTVLNQTGGTYRRVSVQTDVAGLSARIQSALAAQGDRNAIQAVNNAAKQPGTPCDKEDLAVRVEALNSLSQTDPESTTPILARLLARRDECSAALRRSAIYILGRRSDDQARNLVINAARTDPDIRVRGEALRFLAAMPGDEPVATIEEMARTPGNEELQRAAIEALGRSDSPRAKQSLRNIIERTDLSENLRVTALSSVDPEHSPDNGAYIRSVYPRLDTPRLKAAAIRSVARLGGSDNDQFLLSVMRNPNENAEVRAMALRSASRSTIPMADLTKMYDAASDRPLREQLIAVYARRDEPEATDKLLEIARTGTDPDMRRYAISALSRKNDPRTKKLLLEIIDK